MEIQWFPGHMTKTKRMMEEDIKLVDLVVEVVDARIPYSSKNPYLDTLWKKRPRIMALNKIDLADPESTQKWKNWYQEQGYGVVELDSLKGRGLNAIATVAEELCKEKRERDQRKGLQNRPLRLMITGIPNVGKSTVINQLVGRANVAKTGNKPGVTRGKQWIKMKANMELLDTPGILWPKFEDQELGMKIAFIGSIKDELLDMDEMAFQLLPYLVRLNPKGLMERFKINEEDLEVSTVELIEIIGHFMVSLNVAIIYWD